MNSVSVDLENNILNITFVGFISGDVMEKIRGEILKAVENLEPGFHIISDMTNYQVGNDDALKIAHKLIEHISHLEFGKIIRVVGSSRSAVIQSAEVTKNIPGYSVEYVPTMEEAYKLLNINK